MSETFPIISVDNASAEETYIEDLPLIDRISLYDAPKRVEAFATLDTADWQAIFDQIHKRAVPGIGEDYNEGAMKVKSPDGASVTELMAPEERQPFFDDICTGLKQWLETNKADAAHAQEVLDRLSNAIAIALVCAHPYKDGNGRTARTVAGLIRLKTKDADYMDDLQQLFANRPDEGKRISSFLPKKTIDMTPKDRVAALIAPDIPLSDDQAYKQRVSELIATPFG